MAPVRGEFLELLSGGDRRGIARSARVRALIEKRPARVKDLAALTSADDWLVAQRALDLLEKIAHEHPDWIEPYKTVFIGPLADSDKWEIRLQIVRALPLFRWTAAESRRIEQILLENVAFPQAFVRAWGHWIAWQHSRSERRSLCRSCSSTSRSSRSRRARRCRPGHARFANGSRGEASRARRRPTTPPFWGRVARAHVRSSRFPRCPAPR